MKSTDSLAVVILAAGLGTRMNSSVSKVLHKVSGKTILERTLVILDEISPKQTIIVVNKSNKEKIRKLAQNRYTLVLQEKPRGTADALQTALGKVFKNAKHLLVLYGDDNIFYKVDTFKSVYRHHLKEESTITFITVKMPDPTGFGRIYRINNKVVKIVEEKDASANQKRIKEVNDGVYFFKRDWLEKNISKLSLSGATGELYITDLVELAASQGKKLETYPLKDNREYFAITTRRDLKKAEEILKNRIHIMGIRGAGASAVAKIAQKREFLVSGCDLSGESAYDANLDDISIEKGHHKSHIINIAKLIISPAVSKFSPGNPEISEAKKQKIEVVTWQKFQGEVLQKDKFVICVAGAYGKSTTTAMIAKILKDARLDPTCEIGAKVIDWGKNYQVGRSKYYVCEADEYMDNFLNYKPDIAVILNMGWDHPDYFKNLNALENSYKKFIDNLKTGAVLIIGSDPHLKRLANQTRKDITTVIIKDFSPDISIIGDFRKVNANAALTVANVIGINLKGAKRSIANFKGVARRLEFKGKVNDTLIYDDYAVQPYTIRKTANALAKKFKEKKLVLVLEPHTISRIEVFFKDFVNNLKDVNAGKIYITDIYTGREHRERINLSQKLASEIGAKAIYSGSLKNTVSTLKKQLKDYELICSMGAGNVYKLYDMLKK